MRETEARSLNLIFSKCDKSLKFSTHAVLVLFLIFLFSPQIEASACTPFLIYKNMAHPAPHAPSAPAQGPTSTWINKIAQMEGHGNFTKIYERFKPQFSTAQAEVEYLSCIYRYLQMDTDGDGIKDWKIASHQQLFSHLLPLDDDWDNDGISNLFDKMPLKKSKNLEGYLPSHLQLSVKKSSRLNQLQEKIYSTCNVLAINHTDTHSERVLETFLEVCKPALSAFKSKPYNFVLYAFSSHSIKGDIIAAFHAESNFMSIGGSLFALKDIEKIKMTMAHEIGHYFTFNYLTPKELALAAARFGHWDIDSDTSTSFFDPEFLKPSQKTSGFFPTLYARTNIHEWFSEVFATFLYNRSLRAHNTIANHPSSEVDDWMQERFPVH